VPTAAVQDEKPVTGAAGLVTLLASDWVATGAIGVCAGLVMLRAPGLPRWAASWGLVAGAGEVLARAARPG
jgi:hypothetical protein